ncbi:MAG: response regulator transcription factor [Clostridia bacterium]|nr:response regulator transcription factor [Clostridia bacterium]
MNKIKVAAVDDDVVWLSALESFINKQEDIEIVGTAVSKEDAVSLVQKVKVDVILMDINMRDNKRDGILAALEILEFASAKIIMLTSLNEREIIKESFAAGAVQFLSKDDFLELPGTIRKVYRNTSPVEVLVEEFMRLKRQEQLMSLSPSEREIFELIEKGYSRSQIEKKLFKTRNTLKTQIKRIIGKLGVRSTREAVQKVRNKGIGG